VPLSAVCVCKIIRQKVRSNLEDIAFRASHTRISHKTVFALFEIN
jgi:hypothetical protein